MMSLKNFHKINYFLLATIVVSIHGMHQPTSLQYQSAKVIADYWLDTRQLNQPCKEYVSIVKHKNYFLQAKASIILNTSHLFEIIPDHYQKIKTEEEKVIFNVALKKLTEYAVLFSNKEALRLLLDYDRTNANLTIDWYKHTLLMYAAHNPHDIEIAELLLEHGADPAAKDDYDQTVLMHAAKSNNVHLIKHLLKKVNNIHETDINSSQLTSNNAILHAARANAQDATLYLIKKGADINGIQFSWLTPLAWAIKRNNNFLVKELLNRGADINASPYHLIFAVQNKKLDVIQLLCEKHINTNLYDSERNTPLIYAAKQENSIPILQMLLNYNANIDHQNCEGQTALHHAAKRGDLNMITFLCDHHADVTIRDDYYQRAAHIAARSGSKAIVQCLLERHYQKTYWAAWQDFSSRTELLMKAMEKFSCLSLKPIEYIGEKFSTIIDCLISNIVLNKKDKYSYNSWHLTKEIEKDNVDEVQRYLDAGRSVNAVIEWYSKEPILHLAAGYRHITNEKYSTFRDPFCKAFLKPTNTESVHVSQLVLKHGANLYIKNHYRMIPLTIARFTNSHTVENLIKKEMIRNELQQLSKS